MKSKKIKFYVNNNYERITNIEITHMCNYIINSVLVFLYTFLLYKKYIADIMFESECFFFFFYKLYLNKKKINA